MNDIVSYLLDPNKSGVYLTTVSIDLSSLKNLFQEIRAFDEKNQIKSREDCRLLYYEDYTAFRDTMARFAVEDGRLFLQKG